MSKVLMVIDLIVKAVASGVEIKNEIRQLAIKIKNNESVTNEELDRGLESLSNAIAELNKD